MKPLFPNVNARLVAKKYKDIFFYYVSEIERGSYIVRPCLLENRGEKSYMIREFKDNKLDIWASGFEWENLFFTKNEADTFCKQKNELYKQFKYSPFVKYSLLVEHKDVFLNIEKLVDKMLSNFEHYNGIDFCDVSAGGIQIRLHHNQIKNYTYGKQYTIKYDFSNVEDGGLDIALQVVREFIEKDKPEFITSELNMIREGEKYDWN